MNRTKIQHITDIIACCAGDMYFLPLSIYFSDFIPMFGGVVAGLEQTIEQALSSIQQLAFINS